MNETNKIKRLVNSSFDENLDKIAGKLSQGRLVSEFVISHNLGEDYNGDLFNKVCEKEFANKGINVQAISNDATSKNEVWVIVYPKEHILNKLEELMPNEVATLRDMFRRFVPNNDLERVGFPFFKKGIEILFFENSNLSKPIDKRYALQAYNALKHNFHIDSINELCSRSSKDLRKGRGIGENILTYIEEKLAQRGLCLRDKFIQRKNGMEKKGGVSNEHVRMPD